MTAPISYRIVSEKRLQDCTIQLIEDQWGGYRLQWLLNNGNQPIVSAPVHSDQRVLAEAREHFPDVLPFGGLPVDAT